MAADMLRAELDTWPKPGLVSPLDNGSHDDLDYGNFQRASLRGVLSTATSPKPVPSAPRWTSYDASGVMPKPPCSMPPAG